MRTALPVRKLCGDFGGRTQIGEPCKQLAGYNVPHGNGMGPCVLHDPTAITALSEAKSVFLDVYGTGKVTLGDAARVACGVDVRTVLRWRREDQAFAEAVDAVRDEIDGMQTLDVEESWVERLKRGETSGVEVLFYLQNRSKGRWKNVQRHEHTGKDGAPLTVGGIRDLLSEDDEPPPPVPLPPGVNA